MILFSIPLCFLDGAVQLQPENNSNDHKKRKAEFILNNSSPSSSSQNNADHDERHSDVFLDPHENNSAEHDDGTKFVPPGNAADAELLDIPYYQQESDV